MLVPEGVLLLLDLFVGSVELRSVFGFLFHLQVLHAHDEILFPFDFLQLLPDLRIDEVSDVLPVHDFGDLVVLPLLREDVVLLDWHREHSCSTILLLKLNEVWFL